jgi:hypothetical protein
MRRVTRKLRVTAGLKWPPEGGDHQRDREPVRERHADQGVGAADHDSAGAEERQRERTEELRDAPPQIVAFHRARS